MSISDWQPAAKRPPTAQQHRTAVSIHRMATVVTGQYGQRVGTGQRIERIDIATAVLQLSCGGPVPPDEPRVLATTDGQSTVCKPHHQSAAHSRGRMERTHRIAKLTSTHR